MRELFSSKHLTVIEHMTCTFPVKSSIIFDQVDLDTSKSKAWQNKTSKRIADFKLPVSVTLLVGGMFCSVPTNLREKVPFRPDCVNFVLTGNVSEPRHPMTAWIIAHRMCHALQIKQIPTGVGPTHIEQDFWDCVLRVFRSMRIIPSSALWEGKIREDDMVRIANVLMTTKTGREQTIRRPIDIIAELFAQYLCSEVSLATLESASKKEEIEYRPNAKQYFTSNAELIESLVDCGFWDRKELFERMIKRYFNRVIRAKIGKEISL